MGCSSSPTVKELEIVPPVSEALRAFAGCPGLILFDSAKRDAKLGRYSFLSALPTKTFRIAEPRYGLDPFVELRACLEDFSYEVIPGLPPFQGGLAGVLSYELGGCWEQLPAPSVNEFAIPVLSVGLYDWVIAWDHVANRAWVIAQDMEDDSPETRIASVIDRLLSTLPRDKDVPSTAPSLTIETQQYPISGSPGVMSNFSTDQYRKCVARVVEYILAGDIFQANLSQRLLSRCQLSPVDLYLRLREVNAAPFGGCYFDEDWSVLSASPERFLSLSDGIVSSRPIKGTRQRLHGSEIDLYSQDALRESPKDAAENVMIVDLMRNDLSRVCSPGSISVPELCRLESYETVHHLVSEVRGKLREESDMWDLLAATFPGGSITGAPKVRAMQIINELEQIARGPYCGSMFYVGFDGTMDSNILIRTFVQRGELLQCSVGGGIVAQSSPDAEYAETEHKAAGMLRAILPARHDG